MNSLSEKIKALLALKEIIPFSEYMALCLFDKDHGYYTHLTALGKAGDFITAPELGPYLATALFNFFKSESALEHHPIIVELGGGSGQLAFDLLNLLKMQNHLPERYIIIEKSESLQKIQMNKLKALGADIFARVKWCEVLDEEGLSAILIANEFFDALPVERFVKTKTVIQRLGVQWSVNEFVEVPMPETLCLEDLSQDMRPMLEALPQGYCSEISLELKPVIGGILKHFKQGLAIVIDYGAMRENYYHPRNQQGSIAAYRNHRVVSVFSKPGESDLTAHVDFTYLAECFIGFGWSVDFLKTQAQFLLENHVLPKAGIAVENYALKRLLDPRLMGEVFKVLCMRL